MGVCHVRQASPYRDVRFLGGQSRGCARQTLQRGRLDFWNRLPLVLMRLSPFCKKFVDKIFHVIGFEEWE